VESGEETLPKGCYVSATRKRDSVPVLNMVTDKNLWLIGYTLRIAISDALAGGWNPKRRARYLLRPEISFALGFDDVVWPLCGLDMERAALFGEDLTSRLDGNGCGFFEELATLSAGLDLGYRSKVPNGCALVAAVSPRSRESMALPRQELRDRYQSALTELPHFDQWIHLGFDVVESVLGISGLSNTGYTEADLIALRPRYASLVNSFGLVGDVDAAIDLSRDTTARVKEHAPFVPVSLFTFGESR
jgi:hypothetical protein